MDPRPRAAAPRAPAFHQFVLKIHSRCNLACTYCYVYTMADQRWKERPPRMPDAVIDAAVDRIAEHAHAHDLPRVDISLHGGEPLLAGPRAVARCVRRLRARVPVPVRAAMQTNGVLLNDEWLRVLRRLGVSISVSLDGGAAANDRRRVDHRGRGSHDRVAAALRLLGQPAYRALYSGLLCTIDLRHDPVATYGALLAHHPPAVDFLLPHGNWGRPPPGRVRGDPATPYGDWLVAVFDRWYGAPRRETRVRLFEELLHTLLGGRSAVEGVGRTPRGSVVVETDGSIEHSDVLGSAAEGAGATGLWVQRDPFDAVFAVPHPLGPGGAATEPAPACRTCTALASCGGGLHAHRYDPATGFANPSVYCPDLFRLVGHLRARLAADLARLAPAARDPDLSPNV
ncbi:radical SAM protein [Pilimelia anulata]|uniref:Radical SAM protein n=1 Tax=Pilimelia anulata TaxID=53371 RepID=A0A8J3FG06_9ACTN|nr:FxsB family cyclophane-forming radical SAM/SPASM peptide maturase [Pilimelia anulata]GGK07322.1 radical SAM protein [Pilimelia anulata]